MGIEEYLVRNSKGNISWKETAEKMFESINRNPEPLGTGYLCPLCEEEGIESEIMDYGLEFCCENDNCRYDKTVDELFYAMASDRNYTKKRD